ncbi:hypothetical protein [Rubrivirga marina]|uniref:Lipoprotein n=1 Tax=Rubrivirga marina TaxID=1196024 RepID=A0A271J561_9BACT|nr:hypothetical protein [Rubrivirga marina]PAP78095.1 hypothetical protein BSZ37_17455 [Rubrivirga marina]
MPRLLALSLLVTLAWGCASAEDAYVDGMEYETAGDYAAAADAYATALERDRSLPNVAGRLAVAGREAVRRWIAQANAAGPEPAADAYLAAQALVDRAAAVGVDLERPAAFEANREAAVFAALESVYADAEAAYDAGDYARTLDRTRRARRYAPDVEWTAALDVLAVDAHTAWAEADLDAGRFRSAFARIESAAALGPGPDRREALDALRAATLDLGAVVAAVLPAEGDDDVPEVFLRDLTDVLAEDHLAGTDPFVVLVDPADVRRWARERRGGPDLSDSPRRLADAAADLGADLATIAVVDRITEREVAGDVRTERARVRATNAAVTYTLRRIDLTLDAEADVVVVDAAGRTVCDAAVRADGRASYDRASYAGDWRELDLSRSARAAFADDGADRAYADALDALRDRLAAALAARAGRCLSPLVP